MEIVICKNTREMALYSADVCCAAIRKKPGLVMGLATGSTPLELYGELAQRVKKGAVSFRRVTTFNLDEYVGLSPKHPQSYRAFMNKNLFEKIDIALARTHLPDGMMTNPMKAGPAYEVLIRKAGGIDLQILGIGSNGHIGFNEPTSSLGSRTRVKTLTRQTLRDNARFFCRGETMPELAVTMGIGTIMEARRILLLAAGRQKARAVVEAVEGPVTSMCPASALQLHPHVTLVLDEGAAARLQMKKYYRWVYAKQKALDERFGL